MRTVEPAAGVWGRFSRYEVREGYICAAPGATLEIYDPWERDPEDPYPYTSLLALTTDIRFQMAGGTRRFALTPDSEVHLLAWCQAHGLLGLLIQRVQRIAHAPVWAEKDGREDTLVPTQIVHRRIATGWRTQRSEEWDRECAEARRRGTVVAVDERGPGLVPGVQWKNNHGDLYKRPLGALGGSSRTCRANSATLTRIRCH